MITARSLPQLHLRISVSAPPTRSPSLERPETIIPPERKSKLLLKGQDEWRGEVNSIESPLRLHPPIDDAMSLSSNSAPLSPTIANANAVNSSSAANPNPASNNVSLLPNNSPLLPNATTTITTTLTLESPIEVFIDDLHHCTLSRSPSPIRYARPDSHDGYLSDLDLDFDDDGEDNNDNFGSDVGMEWVLAAAPGGGVDGEEMSDYSETGLSAEGDAASGDGVGGGGGGYGSRRRGRRMREQLRSYRNSYRPRGANDASPPRIPYRSVSPSSAAGVERRGQQKPDKEREKEKEKEKAIDKDNSNKSKNNSKKKKSELNNKGLRGSSNSLHTRHAHACFFP